MIKQFIMKKYTYLLISLLFSFSAYAQNQINGKVYDAYNQTPLEGVSVILSKTTGATTNKKGEFIVDCNGASSITIKLIGYQTYTGTIKDCNQFIQIGLIPSNSSLNEVQISATKTNNNIVLTQPQSIGLLSRQEITRNDAIFPESYLNLIPGVRMEKRTSSGGQRILIRGYGYPAGSGNGINFNGSGIKAYLNGIPVTDAEGVSIFDDIDFSTLGKVEVIKGPASSIYGTGIGGVVNMYTMKPAPQTTQLTQEFTAGSYGLYRTNTRLETADDKSSILLNYGHQNYDGYRIHSAEKKDFVNFVGDFRSSDKESFSAYAGYSTSYDQLAGQLSTTDFLNKVNTGEAQYIINDGHIQYESFRSGLSHTYTFSKYINNVTSAYTSNYQLSQASAAGLTSNFYRNVGARSVFNLSFTGNTVSLYGTVGSEYQKTSSFRKSNALSATGALGGLTADLEVAAVQYSMFTEWNLELPAHFTLTAGLSDNNIEYGVTDKLTNTANPTHKDQSGYKVFSPVATPRFAFQKVFKDTSITAYVSYSQGYSPPTSANTIVPYTGQVLTGLKPERANQWELGSKGSLLNKKLSYQVALFDLKVDNKFTQQAVYSAAGAQLYSYTINGGSQSNKGVEIAVNYSVFENKNDQFISMLRPFVNYTYSHFRYDNYKSDNNNNAATVDYSGKAVLGVPANNFNAGFDLGSKLGIYLLTTYQYVDKLPITFDNKQSAPSYSLLNAKLGYRKSIGKHVNFDVFAGLNNITQSLYYNLVFLSVYTDKNTPIYLPAAYNATFYGGLNFTYRF